MRNHLVKMLVPVVAIMAIMAGNCRGAQAEEATAETFAMGDGSSYFLVPLTAPAAAANQEFTDVAILVDVSASQMSPEVRKNGQDAVTTLVSNLPENARVQIFTVDNETLSLTEGFVPKTSPKVQEALESLKTNTPLGAADLEKSIRVASASFDFFENANRSIAFIGRGISTSAVFDEATFVNLVETLHNDRVPVNVFANGTMTNLKTLGALANQTGGYVVDPAVTSGTDAGTLLAKAATATVYWPTATEFDNLPNGVTLYPNPLPPIRSDRETYVVGMSQEQGVGGEFSLPVIYGDQVATDLTWTVQSGESKATNQYLYKLVENASRDQGQTLPLAGRVLLNEVAIASDETAESATELAQEAIEAGDVATAERLAKLAKDQAPQSEQANQILAQTAAFDKAESVLMGAPVSPIANENGLMQAASANQAVATSAARAEVAAVRQDARKLAVTDPDGAIDMIKQQISGVKRLAFLSDQDRDALLSDLANEAVMLRRVKADKELRDYRSLRDLATTDSKIKAMQLRETNQKKIEEMMKRFNALVDQQQFVLAWEVATAAAELTENLALPVQAAHVVAAKDAYTENQDLRIRRRKGFLDVLMSVERSNVPISDEPPIIYPDPETWLALSKQRKEKYSDTSLFTESEQSQKISKALDAIVDVEGSAEAELSLQDWLSRMSKELDFNVFFDSVNIEETAGPPSSLFITQPLHGITLRNALKHVLRPYELSFTVVDDALFITTQDELKNNADLATSLRVYPVPDLIFQPNSGQSGGGFGGGMSNGMNGGSGGMGGFGGRGGNMGGGGGWFVPAEKPLGTDAVESAPAENLDQKWDAWFTANMPQSPALDASETEEAIAKNNEALAAYEKEVTRFNTDLLAQVLDFCKGKQYDEAKALIKSYIRTGTPASWVYEALVLVLLQSNAPEAEVEKAILSVADFTSDPITVLGVAAYLETVGYKARALKLYREVSKASPARPEPYVRGLALAQELNDEEAQKWVALGIASQAWEGKLVEDVWQSGLDMARSLVDKMTEEGRTEEAAAFEKAMSEALVRDVIVEVHWTGEAEIDLAVQEPTNTVCWYGGRRTTAGGILRRDPMSFETTDAQKEGERVRVYTCPMGYNGEYNVLVSRTWGELPQGKVGVRIITNAGSEQEHSAFQTVELKDDQAAFTVSLENGRRHEDEKEEFLTTASLINQMQIHNQKVLSDKVATYSDNRAAEASKTAAANQAAAAGYESSYRTSSVPGATTSSKATEYSLPEVQYTRESGYMPIVDFFSVGVDWMAGAVPMDARRYILFSGPPEFTGLVRMFTYNSSDGSSGGGSGGGYGGNSGGGYGNNSNGNNSYGGGNNRNGNSNNSYGGNNNSNSSRNSGGYGGNSGGW
ncbi:MAG: hypothetical protein Q4G68_09650 [Planctomycetia bacterium]|nr:hypothetical protein [Planctomycetia bacterium]